MRQNVSQSFFSHQKFPIVYMGFKKCINICFSLIYFLKTTFKSIAVVSNVSFYNNRLVKTKLTNYMLLHSISILLILFFFLENIVIIFYNIYANITEGIHGTIQSHLSANSSGKNKNIYISPHYEIILRTLECK